MDWSLAGEEWPVIGGVPVPDPRTVIVPFKANQDRRQHIPKQRHKVTNWAVYDRALRQRGSLTVWFTEAAIAAWKAEPRGTRRPAALLGLGDHDGADAAGGLPSGAAPDRRTGRIDASAAWSRSRGATPFNHEPTRRDIGCR